MFSFQSCHTGKTMQHTCRLHRELPLLYCQLCSLGRRRELLFTPPDALLHHPPVYRHTFCKRGAACLPNIHCSLSNVITAAEKMFLTPNTIISKITQKYIAPQILCLFFFLSMFLLKTCESTLIACISSYQTISLLGLLRPWTC